MGKKKKKNSEVKPEDKSKKINEEGKASGSIVDALPTALEDEEDGKSAASVKSVVITVIAALVAAAALAFAVLHFIFGWTFTKYTTDNGVKITFFGRVDGDGQPLRGRFSYSTGLTGYVNSETGKIEYTNGTVYEGKFTDLQKEGVGVLTITQKDKTEVYEGEFSKDEINGKGTYKYANGDVYEGEFRNGNKEGTGKYTWANGAYYEGSYKANKKDGKGVFHYASGAVYEGDFKDDLKNGEGVYTWPSGDKYTGSYVNEKREGHGRMEWSDGSYYEGEFKDNNMNGQGFYRDAEGRTYEGIFENGTPVRVVDKDDVPKDTAEADDN